MSSECTYYERLGVGSGTKTGKFIANLPIGSKMPSVVMR